MTTASRPLIALAAGGTGGHVFPALAVAELLQARGMDTLMLTDGRGARLMQGHNPRILAAASPFQGGMLRRLTAMVKLSGGFVSALALLLRRRPAAMIGFGGYPSFAPMLAARIAGIPSLLHEQNGVLGRANRLLARLAGHLATSWPETAGIPAGQHTKVTGMPVRQAFFDSPEIADGTAGHPNSDAVPDDSIRLTIIGGSLGAAVFANLVPDALAKLDATTQHRLHVTQQCRAEQLDQLTARYAKLGITADIRSFFDDMPAVLAASHLVISRAGASSVAELAAAGRAALLVPFAGAMDDHQTANARTFEATGGGICLAEAELSATILSDHLSRLLDDASQLNLMGRSARSLAMPDAAARIADYALMMARQPSSPFTPDESKS